MEPSSIGTEFNTADLQKLQEVRINTALIRLTAQRDEALNKLVWAEAELQVQNDKVKILLARLQNFSEMFNTQNQVIETLKTQIKEFSIEDLPTLDQLTTR